MNYTTMDNYLISDNIILTKRTVLLENFVRTDSTGKQCEWRVGRVLAVGI